KSKGGGSGQNAQNQPPPVKDVDLIPGNAQTFVMVRVADLVNNDLTRKILAEVAKSGPLGGADLLAMVQQKLGTNPADIERATFVVADFQPQTGALSAWGVVTSSKPFDRSKLYQSVFAGGAQQQPISYAGVSIAVGGPPQDRTGLCFLSDTLL